MRAFLLISSLLAAAAWADVPGPKTVCIAPDGCVSCENADTDCIAAAQDAGLVLSDCVSTRGVPTRFVCPPGHPAVASCGCSNAPVFFGVTLAVLVLLFRRKR